MYLGGIFHIIPTIRLFKKFATTTEKNMDKKNDETAWLHD